MKKTLIIVAVIAVMAVVAFLLFRKKDDGADGKTMGLENPNAETDAETEDFVKHDVLDNIETNEISSFDLYGYNTTVQQQVPYLLGMTEGEIKDYRNKVSYINGVIAKDLSGSSYELVNEKYEEVKEMKEIDSKLRSELGDDYSGLDFTKNAYNELRDVKTAAASLRYDNEQKLKVLASNFISQFQVDSPNGIRSQIKGTPKRTWLVEWKPWDEMTMNDLAKLTEFQAKFVDDYVKTNMNHIYTSLGKVADLNGQPVSMSGKGVVGVIKSVDFNAKGNTLAQKVINNFSQHGL